jgi:predicted nucleic acid-binding protein
MAVQGENVTAVMKLVITDTNVFFDIISIGALPEFFELEYEICTTDFIVKEIMESAQKELIESFIRANKLNVFKISGEDIEEIRNFPTRRIFKGITDKTVLWKAHKLNCPLLTGDKKLRNEAKDLKIEVHGSIWVILSLVEKEIITKATGAGLMERLKLINSSLPHDEIDKLIKRLKQ